MRINSYKSCFLMSKKFLIRISFVLLVLVFFLGTFRTYMVKGVSDAPTFSSGDKVIINRSAYDITLPFSNFKLIGISLPERGDMVLCKVKRKENGDYWLKRIIGLPGDTIELKQNKIFINGTSLKYEVIRIDSLAMERNNLCGALFAIESGKGLLHKVSFSDKKGLLANFGPLIVMQNHYFVLGDNRDNSMDSRLFGSVHRNHIYGKFLLILSKNNTYQ